MNDELKEKAKEVLIQMINDLQHVRDFTLEQAPEVIEQLLRWKMTEAFLIMSFSLAAAVCVLYTGFSYAQKLAKEEYPDDFVVNTACIITIVLALLPFSFFCTNFKVWLQITMAPKIWLLEYAANLAR